VPWGYLRGIFGDNGVVFDVKIMERLGEYSYKAASALDAL
jgi:hypothetical protein